MEFVPDNIDRIHLRVRQFSALLICGVILFAPHGQARVGRRTREPLLPPPSRGSVGEVTRRVKDGFVPLLRELPGFRNYYLLDGGQDTLISIRAFDSADEALASNEIAAEWMRDNVFEFVKGMPEVMAGDVIIAESK